MKEKEQSSIEWLIQELDKVSRTSVAYWEEVKKAKELHKKEIIEAYERGILKGEHQWIKIKDREPDKGREVLVKGICIYDMGGKEKGIGLVKYNKKSKSYVKDTCGMDYYTKITEWCEVE